MNDPCARSQPDGPAVTVEVLVLRRTDDDHLAYRLVTATVVTPNTPDLTASGLVDGATLVHSTSWRHEQGSVVLTYVALPDPQPHLSATTLHEPSVVCSGHPLVPQPPVLHRHHVAAHAIRHLAYLLDHDEAIARHRQQSGDGLWALIVEVAAGIPTSTHDRAHHLAGRTRVVR